jgi:hypothetical protein
MQNMCCASGLAAMDDAPVGVFGFIGRSGRPVSCAVTPYLDGGQPVVTSTLALVGKIGAVLRDDRVALLAGGAQARGRATVAIEDDEEWFDRAIRAQELHKYPPARFLLRLPGGPVCLLVHEESAGLSDLRQLRLEGELVSGRLSVRRRSGTLAAAHRGPLAQLRDLTALGRAATANRTRIESWKTRPGPDRKATARISPDVRGSCQ